MREFLLLIFSLGMYAKPFDRKEYIRKQFNIFDIAYCETDPVASQLRGMNIRMAVDNAESSYYMRVTNRRMVVVTWLLVIVTTLSIVFK